MRTLSRVAATFALAGVAGAAQAHVAVQPASATAASVTTLTFVVGHGCDGQATTALRVELPAAITAAAPEPKAGWTITAERMAGGVLAVTWRGELPGHQPDSFPIRVTLPAASGRLALPAVQTCGAVEVRWDEAASAGGPCPTHPAPVILLSPAT